MVTWNLIVDSVEISIYYTILGVEQVATGGIRSVEVSKEDPWAVDIAAREAITEV